MVHTFQTLNPDRLDRHVVAQVPDVSRNQAQRLIENGHVIVAGQVVVKPAASVAAGGKRGGWRVDHGRHPGPGADDSGG